MRQAIEEGFIHDVLINYTTYQSFYQLNKKIEDDPELNKKKAASAIARFATLHPYVLAQKTEVIIEHFRQVTMKKIGGKAKAMVVTASREHVVRYKHEFDRYLNEKGYSDIKALVAFSGTVLLDGIPPEYTETGMNGFGEKELPERFAGSEYQILLVAEKYQTGYDEPLLHSMYVDKRLDGVKAVQTLSRLNRTCPGKEDTFILDFVNKREDILAAFQPYYEQTQLTDVTDPNKLYDLKTKIDSFKIIVPADVEAFCEVFFKNKDLHNKREHGQLNALIDVAVVRFDTIEKDDQKDDFVNTLGVFVRLYAFLAQIMPFQDVGLEKFYAYSRFLLKKLPGPNRGPRYDLGYDVALEYYRLQKISEGQIALQKESGAAIKPISEAGTKKDKDEYARLSEIINLLNDRFGTDFTEADKLFFDQIEEEMVLDEKLGLQAVATSFREQTKPKIKGWKPMNGRKVSKDMFIAQVVGKSMEPTIAEGSWCLFRFERGGSRHGIFLIESRQVKDPETGLAFTIKRYHSEKEDLGNDQWRHKRIILSPDNKDFKDIVLENVSGDDFRVVAEFVQIVAS